MHKTIAGLLVVAMLCSLVTGCSKGNNPDELNAAPDSSEASSVSTGTGVNHEVEPEAETASSETASSESIVEFNTMTPEEAENAKAAIDSGLRAYQQADMDGIVKYTDMELYYYAQFGKPSESEADLVQKLKDYKYVVTPVGVDDVTWDVEIYSYDDEGVSDMRNWLEVELPAQIAEEKEEKANTSEEAVEAILIPTFEEVKELYNISDVCIAHITSYYKDDEAKNGIGESSVCFYAFKMNGEWKLDFMYSQSYAVSLFNKEFEGVEEDPC